MKKTLRKSVLVRILKYAALQSNLKRKDYRVLLYLMPRFLSVEKDKYIRINQLKIADDLEIAKNDVSRAIKHLIEAQIIEPENKSKGWKLDIQLYPYSKTEIESKLYEEEEEEDEEDDD